MGKSSRGALFMILSAMSFSAMQIVIAKSAGRIPLFEQMFFRNLLASGVALANILRCGYAPFGQRQNRLRLILRSVMGYLGMICLFYASAHAAQGDVAVINKMSPFLVTLLAVLFLKEKVSGLQLAALVLAFLGGSIVSNPSFHSDSLPILAAVLSAVFSGAAYTFVSSLRGREPPTVIIFFFSAFSTLVTGLFMAMDFVMPTLAELAMLAAIGVFAMGGQLALTYAYAIADASEVSICNYSGILFSMLFGKWFLGQPFTIPSVAGAVLVMSAGFLVFLNHKIRLCRCAQN